MVERAGEAAELRAGAAELGVDLAPERAQALLDFRDLVARWNSAVNLVSRRDIHRLVPRHLLDSLTVVPWLCGHRTLDVGTGAGFPGVPLAIAREDVHFTLIDSSERKIRFVNRAVRALGLTNVTALCADVRALAAEARFDTVVCRGVGDPASLWALAGPRVAPEGRMVIMSRTGAASAAKGNPPLPEDVCLEGRHGVRIPDLEHTHELTLLRHRAATTGEAC